MTEDTTNENHVKEHGENILPSSENGVGLADKLGEECAAAAPPETSEAQNKRKRHREWLEISVPIGPSAV